MHFFIKTSPKIHSLKQCYFWKHKNFSFLTEMYVSSLIILQLLIRESGWALSSEAQTKVAPRKSLKLFKVVYRLQLNNDREKFSSSYAKTTTKKIQFQFNSFINKLQ